MATTTTTTPVCDCCNEKPGTITNSEFAPGTPLCEDCVNFQIAMQVLTDAAHELRGRIDPASAISMFAEQVAEANDTTIRALGISFKRS